MNTPTETDKSCDPQPLPQTEPSSSWPLDDLGRYARQEYEAIVCQEQGLAACYWRLGNALALARKQFTHGQWKKYLETLGIEKTRCSKAIAIYRSFPVLEDAARLTVEQAYQQRERKPRMRPATPDTEPPSESSTSTAKSVRTSLEDFLRQLPAQAEYCSHEAAFAEGEEAKRLLGMLDQAMASLEEIRRNLLQQYRVAPTCHPSHRPEPRPRQPNEVPLESRLPCIGLCAWDTSS